jgi:hypothetical protein
LPQKRNYFVKNGANIIEINEAKYSPKRGKKLKKQIN